VENQTKVPGLFDKEVRLSATGISFSVASSGLSARIQNVFAALAGQIKPGIIVELGTGSGGCFRPLTRYLAQNIGAIGVTACCIARGVIATGQVGTWRIAPKFSNSFRPSPPHYATGALIPIDRGLLRR
jgi:hypothetical protein